MVERSITVLAFHVNIHEHHEIQLLHLSEHETPPSAFTVYLSKRITDDTKHKTDISQI